MRGLSWDASAETGRNTLLILGVVYTGFAILDQFLLLLESAELGVNVIIALLVGVPGLVLLYIGYTLPQTDIRPEYYPTVTAWCLAAITVLLAILGLIEIASELRDPVHNILILTALASNAGLIAGRYDARAKTRTRELELRNAELEQTKADLETTVERFQTANERLEQFTYAASHDLQEPLRMVSSYLQLLESQYREDLDDDAQDYIDFAVDGADRMRAMVESLLEYSQVSTHGEPLMPTDTRGALNDVLEDLHDRINETEATITTDDLPPVNADAEQLRLVFKNLVSNAITYSGDAPPRVHISAKRVDEKWRFSVADEGIGIDPEYHNRVFQVFENLNATEEREVTGAPGIGLALTERIIERHGGEIWVESSPGEGATF